MTDLTIENIKSVDPSAFGFGINGCDRVHISNVTCRHSAESNSDGIHFRDTSNVTGGSLNIQTAGDDGFIIEAYAGDVKNYALSGIYVNPLNKLALPSRGILLLGDSTVLHAARTISNVSLSSCVVEAASGSGVVLQGVSLVASALEVIVKGGASIFGLLLHPGLPGYPGKCNNNSFKVTVADITGSGVTVSTTDGTVTNNYLDAQVYNPGNNSVAVSLRGTEWTGSVNIDYNSTGAQPFNFGLDVFDQYNDLIVSCKGASKAINCRASSNNNTFRLGTLRDSTVTDVNIGPGSTDNSFIGGRLSSVVNLGGPTNKFYGVKGATSYGSVNLDFATLANGVAEFSHGLVGNPSAVNLTGFAGGVAPNVHVWLRTSSDPAKKVAVYAQNASTGAALTAGTYVFNYHASL